MKKFLNKFSIIFETALFPLCLVVVILFPTLFLTKKDISIFFPICLVFVTFMSYAYWKILDLQRAITRLQNYCLSIVMTDGLQEVIVKIDSILNYSPEENEDITKEVWEIIDFEDSHKFADANKVRETLSVPTFVLNCIIQEARLSNDRNTLITVPKPKKGDKQNE